MAALLAITSAIPPISLERRILMLGPPPQTAFYRIFLKMETN
jgi:hypothetical protein